VRIERLPIADLVEDPRNARVHGEANLAAIRASLERFGQVEPLVVQASTRRVIGGNGRLSAMRALGILEADVALVDINDRGAAELGIALNRIPELADWNAANLGEILREFERTPEELAALGFSEDELRGLAAGDQTLFRTVTVRIDELRPHPKNYRAHPPDQIAQLASSIREHGFFRNVVVARDGTILAGHGVVEAARSIGRKEVPVVRIDVDPDGPRALRVLAADNEIARLAENDDRALSELLRWLADADETGLEGTGFDRQQLAALAMVTRPEGEIADEDAAEAWAGMPGFEPRAPQISLVLAFEAEAERDKLISDLGIVVAKKTRQTWSAWWPPREREDLASLRITDGD